MPVAVWKPKMWDEAMWSPFASLGSQYLQLQWSHLTLIITFQIRLLDFPFWVTIESQLFVTYSSESEAGQGENLFLESKW